MIPLFLGRFELIHMFGISVVSERSLRDLMMPGFGLPDTDHMSQITEPQPATDPSALNTLSADGVGDAVEHEIENENLTRFVIVELNQNMYGISTGVTVELMATSSTQITRVSHAPEFVRGVINHRGTIIPAIDMRSLLSFESQDIEEPSDENDDNPHDVHHGSSNSMMVITEFEGKKLGLIVDAVHSVFDCDESHIEALPDSTTNAEFLQGLVHQPDGSYILISDIEQIYSKTKHE